jgi:PAS domain S-box-containing protein
MPPNFSSETKMTAVSCSEDHPRKNGAIEPNDDLITREFDWVHSLFVPVFVFDGHLHRVVAWNSKMENLTSIAAERIVTESIGSILKEESTRILASTVEAVIGGRDSAVCNIFLSDSGKYLALNMSAHRGGNGKNTQIVCFTEELKSEDSESSEPSLHPSFPMLSLDSQGKVTGWNAPLESLTGYCMRDVIDRSFLEFVPEHGHHERISRSISLPPGSVQGRSCVVDFMLRDGSLKRMVINASPGDYLNSGLVAHYLILSDASDLGEEDAFEESEPSKSALHDATPSSDETRALKQLFENAGAAIFGIDTTGKVKEWNNKIVEITGFSAGEALNQDLVGAFISPHFQAAVRGLLRKGLRGRGTSSFELEIQTKNGEIRYLLVNTNPRRDLDNRIVGVVAIAQDITESCKHDRAVASMANELRKLIDTANAPIFGIDKDG